MKTKHVQYQTSGTCSVMIDVTADENDIIQQVFFLGGCNGNLQGISQLVRGQKIDDVEHYGNKTIQSISDRIQSTILVFIIIEIRERCRTRRILVNPVISRVRSWD